MNLNIKNKIKKNKDTGSSEIQISLFTLRIKKINIHLKNHKKDYHSKLGLIKIINKRKKLLKYLKKKNFKKYINLISKLNLRK